MKYKMEYNQYSFKTIKNLIAEGAKLAGVYKDDDDVIRHTDFGFSELEFVLLGFHNPDYIPDEPREYYRIGEPRENRLAGCYCPSWNSAEERQENGVSVVTTAWLNSFKSVFFGTTDEKIAARGVWKIKGFALPSRGGDAETLICPLDWAEKTRIRTRSGLEKAVKAAGF